MFSRPLYTIRASTSGLLCLLVFAQSYAVPHRMLAQAAAVTAGQAAPKALLISIIEGEGELNDIRARTAREPIVEVQDENHRPVAGALVLFSADPGGSARLINFSGNPSVAVRTGLDGRATANGFQTTHKTGQLRILVTASVGGLVVEAVLHQQNYASGNRLERKLVEHKRLLATSAGVAAAAALIVLLTRKDGTSIQPGVGVVRGVVVPRP